VCDNIIYTVVGNPMLSRLFERLLIAKDSSCNSRHCTVGLHRCKLDTI